MNHFSIPEPSLIDIVDHPGLDEQEMFSFAQRWTELLDSIDSARAVGINYRLAWSNEMESLIWEEKTKPAWAKNKDWRPRMIEMYSGRLRKAFEEAPPEEGLGPLVDVQPSINGRADDDAWQRATMGLLARAVSLPGALLLDAGTEGTESRTLKVRAESGQEREVSVSHGNEDFIRILPTRELCEAVDATNFSCLVDLAAKQFVQANPERAVEYQMEFGCDFLDQFVRAPRQKRKPIVDAIVSRVTQGQKSAMADSGLHDEPCKDERRFRVDDDWRIHYVYIDGPGVKFISVGDHDFGLKK